MAQVIKMIVPAGSGTITAKKINISSDAVVETSSSVSVSTNGGIYSASFTDSTTGTFLFRLYDDGVAFASIVIAIDAASGTWGETEDIDSEVKKIPRAAATLTAGEFTGKRLRYTHSSGDTVVVKTTNTDAMRTLVSAYATESALVTTTGDHGDSSNYDSADMIAFFDRCV